LALYKKREQDKLKLVIRLPFAFKKIYTFVSALSYKLCRFECRVRYSAEESWGLCHHH